MALKLVSGQKAHYSFHRSTSPSADHLLLVHGAGGNHQHWGAAVRRLADANTYALDLPGHGRSAGAGRRSVSEYATFVVQFMDAMGIERGVVAGHSMGGAIALSAALDKPGRVAGLVLVGTGARLRVLPTILEGTLTDWPATAQLVCQYAYSSKAPAALVQLGQRQMLAVPGETVHDDFAACNDFDVTNRLGEIRCPTLVLCGTEDNLTPPKYSAFLAEQIHGARLRLIEKAGHMVMIEKEREVAEAISEWLRQCLS